MYQDKNLDLARKRLVVNANTFTGLNASGQTISPGDTGDVALTALGSSVGLAGLNFTTYGGSRTSGDSSSVDIAHVRHAMHLPTDVDVNHPIGVSILWTTESITVSDRVHWEVRVTDFAVGDAMTSAGIAADTHVLDTPLEEQTVDDPSRPLRQTSRGIINPGRIDKGDFIIVNISNQRSDMGDDEELYLLALILDYMPKLTRGPGARNDRDYETPQVDYKY